MKFSIFVFLAFITYSSFGQVEDRIEAAKARLEAKTKASTRPATTQAAETEVERLRRIVGQLGAENQKLKDDNARLRTQLFQAAKLLGEKAEKLEKDTKTAKTGIAVGMTVEDVKAYAKLNNYSIRVGSFFGDFTTYVIGKNMYVTVDGSGKVTSAIAP